MTEHRSPTRIALFSLRILAVCLLGTWGLSLAGCASPNTSSSPAATVDIRTLPASFTQASGGGAASGTAGLTAAPTSAPVTVLTGIPATGVPATGIPATGIPATSAPAAQPAIPEQRLLTLEWPSAIRTGDSDLVRVSLEMDSQGKVTPTAQVSGNQIRGQSVQIPNLYETHNVLVAARFDLAGVEVTPADERVEPLQPGQTVTFYWSVHPEKVGDYSGTIQLHLHFVPLDGSAESQRALSTQVVKIHAVNFLGLGGAPARVAGAAGLVLGSLLSLDNVANWIIGRVRKKPAGS